MGLVARRIPLAIVTLKPSVRTRDTSQSRSVRSAWGRELGLPAYSTLRNVDSCEPPGSTAQVVQRLGNTFVHRKGTDWGWGRSARQF